MRSIERPGGRPPGRRPWREGRRETTPAEVLHVLKGRRLLVVGAVLVLGGVALLFGLLREPSYTAEAVAGFTTRETPDDENAREALAGEVFSRVTTPAGFSEAVRDEAGWDGNPAAFRDRLVGAGASVSGEGEMVVRVTFSGRTPEEAARVANAYAALFAREAGRLDGEELSGGASVADAWVARRAVPSDDTGPGALVYAAVAAGVGLLVGGGVALLLEGRAGGWRGVRDAEVTLRAPVLGAIPDYSRAEPVAEPMAEPAAENEP